MKKYITVALGIICLLQLGFICYTKTNSRVDKFDHNSWTIQLIEGDYYDFYYQGELRRFDMLALENGRISFSATIGGPNEIYVAGVSGSTGAHLVTQVKDENLKTIYFDNDANGIPEIKATKPLDENGFTITKDGEFIYYKHVETIWALGDE